MLYFLRSFLAVVSPIMVIWKHNMNTLYIRYWRPDSTGTAKGSSRMCSAAYPLYASNRQCFVEMAILSAR